MAFSYRDRAESDTNFSSVVDGPAAALKRLSKLLADPTPFLGENPPPRGVDCDLGESAPVAGDAPYGAALVGDRKGPFDFGED
mmetsp:Transcript_19331/g.41616  ORF Transcript_19331/g.41616 Transcript_19331/m.41616 type:complete len:83 (+) Transcript_19331:931-1179(+)